MHVIVFDRSLSNAHRFKQTCVRFDLTLTVHHSLSHECLAACPSSRILIFDQTVLGNDRAVTLAMYRALQQDAIAVTCENPTVSYAVAHMQMGAHWVFAGDSSEDVLNTGFSSLLNHVESVKMNYREHLDLQAKFSAISLNEWKVVHLVLAGKRNKEIAKSLDVSIRTVESRRSKAYGKVGTHNLVGLVRSFDRATFLGDQFQKNCAPSLDCMNNFQNS